MHTKTEDEWRKIKQVWIRIYIPRWKGLPWAKWGSQFGFDFKVPFFMIIWNA
jgi:hypothetical protein